MTYLISTGVLVLFLAASAASYLFSDSTIQGVRDLGFPDFFRIQLAVMKIAAAVVLALPIFPVLVKEWAYVGAALFIVTAFVAHFAHGDPIWLNLINVGLFAVLVVSYLNA